ncbi:hypothetical protein SESBI_49514 [Sesbania bispinosa]|nr:hypothetical protein SESBI_49514 [Sesbania bispinosa]
METHDRSSQEKDLVARNTKKIKVSSAAPPVPRPCTEFARLKGGDSGTCGRKGS